MSCPIHARLVPTHRSESANQRRSRRFGEGLATQPGAGRIVKAGGPKPAVIERNGDQDTNHPHTRKSRPSAGFTGATRSPYRLGGPCDEGNTTCVCRSHGCNRRRKYALDLFAYVQSARIRIHTHEQARSSATTREDRSRPSAEKRGAASARAWRCRNMQGRHG